MLVLTRREGEAIYVNGEVRVTICRVEGKRVKIGIEAPDDVRVSRRERASEPPAVANASSSIGVR